MSEIMLEKDQLERSLKALVENKSTINKLKEYKANLTHERCKPTLGQLSYDEAVKLAMEAQETLTHLPAFDPAYAYTSQTKDLMLNWADTLNTVDTMGRHDHEIKVHGIVSVDDVTVECEFYIPMLHYHPSRREQLIKSYLQGQIGSDAQWRASFRHAASIDFVEL